jgi:hypothetical protein
VLLLGGGYGLFGRAENRVKFGPDFNKNQAVFMAGDDIYLSLTAAVVGFQNAVAFLLEKVERELFAKVARRLTFVRISFSLL